MPSTRHSMHLPTPYDGAEHRRRLTVRGATELSAQLLSQAEPPVGQIVEDGLARLRQAIALYREGKTLDDVTAVRLAFDLQIIRIRDEAWLTLETDPATAAALTAMLVDLARHVDDPFLAPVGSLLAVSAWLNGEVGLARRAVATALAVAPSYSMAHLVGHALNHHLPAPRLSAQLPTIEEIDAAMGTPHAGWLRPLQWLLAVYLESHG